MREEAFKIWNDRDLIRIVPLLCLLVLSRAPIFRMEPKETIGSMYTIYSFRNMTVHLENESNSEFFFRLFRISRFLAQLLGFE